MNRKRRRAKPTPRTRSGMRRRWRGGLALVVVVVGAAWIAWFAISGRRGDGSGKSGRGSARGGNVLLITLDTTRADRLGCYGHEAAQTPAMDALAESGVRFERAFCQVPLTLPSHVSLLTGLSPPTSGVRINGATGLSSEVPTLATVFKDHGYRTGAFIAAVILDSTFGLGRGFDRYDDKFTGEAGDPGGHWERRADRVCDAALSWANERPEEAFFAWVHFFDPHTPYDPPEGYARGFADPYDGEIAFVDSQVRRLVQWLDEAGLRDRTLIVLVGDHGEGLGDHGEVEHGYYVYDTTMHVPLILSSPAHFSTPQTVSGAVRLLDVFPTIVDLMGWDVPDALAGRSLVHACRSGEVAPLPVYGESDYPLNFRWAPLRSLMMDQWKYIDAPKPELYDRTADPGEVNNVVEVHASIAEQMRNDLREMIVHMKAQRHTADPIVLDDAMRDQLATLGYVAGPSGSEVLYDGVALRDPKDMHDVHTGFNLGMRLVKDGNLERAVNILEPLIRQSPESTVMYAILSAAYIDLGRFEEAQQVVERGMQAVGDTPERLCELATALRQQGQRDAAIGCYKKAVAVAPDWEAAHAGLAQAYLHLKQFSQAEHHCRRCVELDPTSVPYLTNLGTLLVQLGRSAEGVPLLTRAVQYHPANETAQGALWLGLVALDRRVEAIRALKAAREVLPDARSIRCSLAWLLATTPQRTSDEMLDAFH